MVLSYVFLAAVRESVFPRLRAKFSVVMSNWHFEQGTSWTWLSRLPTSVQAAATMSCSLSLGTIARCLARLCRPASFVSDLICAAAAQTCPLLVVLDLYRRLHARLFCLGTSHPAGQTWPSGLRMGWTGPGWDRRGICRQRKNRY